MLRWSIFSGPVTYLFHNNNVQGRITQWWRKNQMKKSWWLQNWHHMPTIAPWLSAIHEGYRLGRSTSGLLYYRKEIQKMVEKVLFTHNWMLLAKFIYLGITHNKQKTKEIFPFLFLPWCSWRINWKLFIKENICPSKEQWIHGFGATES